MFQCLESASLSASICVVIKSNVFVDLIVLKYINFHVTITWWLNNHTYRCRKTCWFQKCVSLVCSSFGFGDMAEMERLDGKHCMYLFIYFLFAFCCFCFVFLSTDMKQALSMMENLGWHAHVYCTIEMTVLFVTLSPRPLHGTACVLKMQQN